MYIIYIYRYTYVKGARRRVEDITEEKKKDDVEGGPGPIGRGKLGFFVSITSLVCFFFFLDSFVFCNC